MRVIPEGRSRSQKHEPDKQVDRDFLRKGERQLDEVAGGHGDKGDGHHDSQDEGADSLLQPPVEKRSHTRKPRPLQPPSPRIAARDPRVAPAPPAPTGRPPRPTNPASVLLCTSSARQSRALL